LFFVSPQQINFQMPLATAAITDFGSLGKVQSSTSTVEIFLNGLLIRAGAAQIAPALVGTFSASQSGQGAAAAIDALTHAPPPPPRPRRSTPRNRTDSRTSLRSL